MLRFINYYQLIRYRCLHLTCSTIKIIVFSPPSFIGHVCHGEDIFECHNHNCVHQTFICDGENDCEDWSDEKHCELEYSTRKAKENYKVNTSLVNNTS